MHRAPLPNHSPPDKPPTRQNRTPELRSNGGRCVDVDLRGRGHGHGESGGGSEDEGVRDQLHYVLRSKVKVLENQVMLWRLLFQLNRMLLAFYTQLLAQDC